MYFNSKFQCPRYKNHWLSSLFWKMWWNLGFWGFFWSCALVQWICLLCVNLNEEIRPWVPRQSWFISVWAGCHQRETLTKEIPGPLYPYSLCTRPSRTCHVPCMSLLVLWWFMVWGLLTPHWILHEVRVPLTALIFQLGAVLGPSRVSALTWR